MNLSPRRGVARAALLAAAAALPAAPSAAQGDRDGAGLSPVVVEALRLPQTDREAGTSVSVITADDIEDLGVGMAVDAIGVVPGVVFHRQGGAGRVAKIGARGAPTDHTLVLIDGIPVNDPTEPGGGFDFARLDTASIERIEILKGPQSTLWGSDAIGGVVAITTKRGEGPLAGSAFAEYGSFASSRTGVSLGGAFGGGSFRVDATRVASDGISAADEADGNDEDDPYRSLAGSAAGRLDLPGGARLGVSARTSDAESEYDGFPAPTFQLADSEHENRTRERSGNLTLDLPTFEGRLEHRFLAGGSRIERRDRDRTTETTTFFSEGDREIYRYQGTLALGVSGRVALGAEREQVEYRTGPHQYQADVQRGNTDADGAFGLVEFRPVGGLTLTAGLRTDDHEGFGSQTTGRAAFSWRPAGRFAFRGSWGEGFKAPTIYQTTAFFFPATSTAGDLKPETSEAFDFGVTFDAAGGGGGIGIAYFRQETENRIDYVGGQYVNIQEVESSGVEFDARYRPAAWLDVGLAYAYTNAEDGAGDRLLRVPRHALDLRATARSGVFSGTVLVRHRGDQLDAGRKPLSAWTRTDLSFQYRLWDGVEAFGRVENLFDRDYQQVLGYGAPGLSAFAGLRFRY